MEYQVSKNNFNEFQESIHQELQKEPLLLIETKSPKIGKWSMSRIWFAWMSSTAKFMAENGVTMPLMIKSDGTPHGLRPFNADDAHLLFTCHWLGRDEQGDRLSWSRSGRDGMRAATKGERFNALRKHESYCLERGIELFQPRDSEYKELQSGN